MSLDTTLSDLHKEIEILKSRTQVDAQTAAALREVKALVYGFGFYDPATEKDRELATLLQPHLDIIFKAFNI